MPNMLFMASLLLALSAVPALSQDGVWTIKKPLSAPRNEVALAATGGKLYVVGGSVGGNAVPLVDEYDPPSDGWRGRAPMPKGLDHLGIQVEAPDELHEVYGRLQQADPPVLEEGAATCCYPKSEKSWITDPQGVSCETFLTSGESTVYGDSVNLGLIRTAACCAPKPELAAEAPCCGAAA